jgi:hypothetical protein
MRQLRNPYRWLAWLGVLACAGGAWAADDYIITPEQKNHWAWRPPVRPTQPAIRGKGWVQNPIDAFVLARLEAVGLQPAPPALRSQLLRRVTFDLVGLPPTPAEVDAFVNDRTAGAWEKVIDRLLASPHYGERWGRHWLDLVRFAESNGYEHDETRPDAWRYRDYVISAFNNDKPYDRFIKEQLAGDELDPNNPDAGVATGFNLLGPDMVDATEQAQRRQNTLNDMTDTAGLVFLGMTIACARCHDHKFEPIPQTDYYRLQAFFTPAVFRSDLPIATPAQRGAHENAMRQYAALTKPARDALAALEAPVRQRLYAARLATLADDARAAHQTPAAQRTAAQQRIVEQTARLLVIADKTVLKTLSAAEKARYQELQQQLKGFDAAKPASLPVAMGLRDAGAQAPRTFLLRRGELHQPAEEVRPGWPIILTPGNEPRPVAVRPPSGTTTGRRTALAEWLASKDNPLTARVLVNRLWQHHFGRGIVATASDFGLRGQQPTHAELLDWLTTEFMDRGWSLKQIHRLMLMSATYQQSTHASPAALAKDPDNQLFSRMNRLRLEGEVIRDGLLAVSGQLNSGMGGPGVFPTVPAEALEGSKGWTVSANPRDHVRRSVYIFARRNLRFPFLEAFDLPDSNLSCPKREQSTTAPQALALLNAADAVQAAAKLAERVQAQVQSEVERVGLAYRLALGRPPTLAEMRLAREFLDESPFRELCRALFNLNEFVYLD